MTKTLNLNSQGQAQDDGGEGLRSRLPSNQSRAGPRSLGFSPPAPRPQGFLDRSRMVAQGR